MRTFNTKDALFDEVVDTIADELRRAINTKNQASLLLSGGSTPAPAYRQLSHINLDWPSVSVGLVDERWVDENHSASNARLVESSLLQNNATRANFIPMFNDAGSAKQGEAECETSYSVFGSPDIIILGMGSDGHTASWFPNSDGLDEAMSATQTNIVKSINAEGCPVAGAHTDRMTVTLPIIQRAGLVLLLITGDEKRTVFDDKNANLPIHQLHAIMGEHLQTYWAP